MSRYEKIPYYFKHFVQQEITQEESLLWCEKYADIVFTDVKNASFKKGVLDFMNHYQTQMAFHLISATPHDELLTLVSHFELEKYFCSVDGAPTKKAIHFQNLLTTYGYQKEEVIYIGDAINDFKASLEVGIGFVGVTQ